LKILFLIPELGYGGAETALLKLAHELRKSHTITLAVFNKTYQVEGYSTPNLNVPFSLVELDQDRKKDIVSLGSRLWRWKRRADALQKLKRQHDITISFLGGANLLNAAVGNSRPSVLSERGSKGRDSGHSWFQSLLWTKFLDPWAHRRADAIVTVSLGLRQEVQQALPARFRARVHAFRGYCDPEQALAAAEAAIEPELLGLERRPLLVAAGRLHHVKGFHLLLPLFARVAQQVADSALLLVGDGPLEVALVELARSLGLRVARVRPGEPADPEAQLILLGYRPHPARYTRLGRAFVLPSLSEGLPNLLLEALAAGAWCLAADCPWGPAEILTEPDLGQLLPPIQDPRSHAQWESALLAALARPLGTLLPVTRRRQVIERFSIHSSAAAWDGLLAQLSTKAQCNEC
jgi:glycosyltransferase involved in cell wall biosynthesis